jgi:signal transduction histidine kinase
VRGRVTTSSTRWVAAAVAVVIGAAAEFVVTRHGEVTTYAGTSTLLRMLELAAACALLLGAVLSWQACPRVAALAIAASVAWLAPDFVGWDAGPDEVRSIALLVSGAALVAVAHLVAGAPSGRTASPAGRVVVALVYLEFVAVTVGHALFRDPFQDPDCWNDCATNLLLVHGDRTVARLLTDLDLRFAIAVGAALPLLALARWLAATAAARRAIAPVLVSGSAFAIAQALWAAQLLRTPLENPRATAMASLFAARSAALIAVGCAIAWGMIRAARTRAAVARLIAELRDAPAALDLQSALALAVGDRDLVVAYPIGDGDRYVDARGRAVEVPAAGGTRAVTSIERGGAPVAVVVHDAAALAEGDLAREVGAAAVLAVDNERLQAQSHAQLEALQASRARVVETADAARRRLERDLHDGAQQRLVSLSLMLRLAADALEPDVAAAIDEAASELRAATVELRELAHGIHPAALSEEGLAAAIRALADRVPLTIEGLELPAARLPAAVETAAYVLVDEAARGYEQARVSLHAAEGVLAVEVAGIELDSGRLSRARDRVAALDGELSLETGRASARIPYDMTALQVGAVACRPRRR